jgi:biopolymer transport protein ExbB/TolQ
MGLIVAIPALYCYAVFRNRVDEYSGEAAIKAEQLVSGFKSAGGAS